MCQSLALPSVSAEYWHIGAMMTRFDSSMSPNGSGWNSWLMDVLFPLAT